MESALLAPTITQKEEVPQLHFPTGEVLFNSEDIASRIISLHYASKLGNRDRYKVKIIFQDDEVMRKVETTVWAVTDKMVVLKMGILIPICRIHAVKFL
jgi:hypothetical protein